MSNVIAFRVSLHQQKEHWLRQSTSVFQIVAICFTILISILWLGKVMTRKKHSQQSSELSIFQIKNLLLMYRWFWMKRQKKFIFFTITWIKKIAKNEFRLHFVKSADNGETWSKPVDITDQITPTEWKKDFKFITSGRGAYTKEGWILNTLVRLKDGVYVFGSKDHGKTWERISSVAEKADETNIVQLPNKDWMLNARIQNDGFRKIFIFCDACR